MKHDKQLTEFRGKTRLELEKIIVEFRGKMWQYKIDLASGKTKNVKEIAATKKGIARALTVLSTLPISSK